MRQAVLASVFLAFTGCSMKSIYPALGGLSGGAAGAALGGIPGAAIGGAAGTLGGQFAAGQEDLKEGEEKVRLLTEGDVAGLIDNQLQDHKTGFDSFVATVKRILTIAGCFLAVYLCIPFFWTQYCMKKERLTRAPFPTKTTGRDK